MVDSVFGSAPAFGEAVAESVSVSRGCLCEGGEPDAPAKIVGADGDQVDIVGAPVVDFDVAVLPTVVWGC